MADKPETSPDDAVPGLDEAETAVMAAASEPPEQVSYQLKGDANRISIASIVVDSSGYTTDDVNEIGVLDAYAAESELLERKTSSRRGGGK